jgi:uracil phosphoribosyltransferase
MFMPNFEDGLWTILRNRNSTTAEFQAAANSIFEILIQKSFSFFPWESGNFLSPTGAEFEGDRIKPFTCASVSM